MGDSPFFGESRRVRANLLLRAMPEAAPDPFLLVQSPTASAHDQRAECNGGIALSLTPGGVARGIGLRKLRGRWPW
jgi:hypothetical protein